MHEIGFKAIINGFRKCSLFPFSPDNVKYSKCSTGKERPQQNKGNINNNKGSILHQKLTRLQTKYNMLLMLGPIIQIKFHYRWWEKLATTSIDVKFPPESISVYCCHAKIQNSRNIVCIVLYCIILWIRMNKKRDIASSYYVITSFKHF